MTTVLDHVQGERFYAVNADCVEYAASLPDAAGLQGGPGKTAGSARRGK